MARTHRRNVGDYGQSSELQQEPNITQDYGQSSQSSAWMESMIKVPRHEHRSSKATTNSQEVLSHISNRSVIKMDPRIESRLQRLRLYQVAKLGNINVDGDLMAGLVERWRFETHCFNFTFGEMTVTLEDVSCLWGLSIQEELITGCSDSNQYKEDLEELLHRPVPLTAFRKQKRNVGGSDATRMTYSQYNLRLDWLRKEFVEVTDDDVEEYLDAYTRAFCLDMIGSILLPNGTGDSVPVMYIQFLKYLKNSPEYNWGSAVLAHLYRNLCRASHVKCRNIYGPLVLLQMWSWTRFNIVRPTRIDRTAGPELEGDDLEARSPFGIKWSKKHMYEHSPHNGIEFYREQYEKLKPHNVIWQPYAGKIGLFHPRV